MWNVESGMWKVECGIVVTLRFGGVPPLSIRGGRSTSFRSALMPNIHYSRSLLIDSCSFALNVKCGAEVLR